MMIGSFLGGKNELSQFLARQSDMEEMVRERRGLFSLLCSVLYKRNLLANAVLRSNDRVTECVRKVGRFF